MEPTMPEASACRVAHTYLDKRASLPTMPRRKLVQMINRILDRAPTKGIHRDQYWKPVQAIWKALEKAGLDFSITKSDYEHESMGGSRVPVRKVWNFEVPFLTERGQPGTIHGRVVAAGAGSVEDPLEAYDVVAYVN